MVGLLERPGHKGEGCVKIYPKEMGCEGMDRIQLAQDRVL
jgi:hypothetical protein